MRTWTMLRAAVVAATLAFAPVVGGCATLDGIFAPGNEVISEQTLSEAELTLNLWVTIADAYTNCGKPDAIPCPDGGAKSDLETVNTMHGLIGKAHAAIVELRAGRGTLNVVWAAVRAVTSYGERAKIKPTVLRGTV